MDALSTGAITQLLQAHREGREGAFAELVETLYLDLRRIAKNQRGRGRRHATMDTTALVHEAYVKLAQGAEPSWKDRTHFLAVAAQAMRHISVDYARSRLRAKRGGGAHKVELEDRHAIVENRLEEHLAIDKALDDVAQYQPRLVHVVECRYFAGMSEEETAAVLDVSVRTVRRLWRAAKLELKAKVQGA